MQKILLIFIYLILSKSISSQVKEEWISIYDGPPANTSTSRSIKINNNKELYMLGSNSNDIVILKYNLSGELSWIARYEGPENGNNIPNEMLLNKRGNIYVAGSSSGDDSGDDYMTIKFDTLGNRIWAVRYSSSGNRYDAAYGIAMDSSENIFVTGEGYNTSTGAIDCITIKYDSSGNQQWISSYQAGLRCIGYQVRTDKWGNCFVTGVGNVGIFTIKYNSDGIQIWNAAYNNTGPESPRKLEIDSSGNIYVAGISNIGNYYDYITIKYDSSGNELWNRRYNGTANYMDQLTDMKVDKYGNVYVTGNGTQTGRGYDFTTIKYNTNGDEQWIAKYHNGLNDIATALTLDEHGSIYVTGRSDGNGTHFDYATVKYDSSGNQKWAIRYNYSNEYDDEASDIAVDNQNNVYVTGNSYIWGRYTVATIKYTQTLTGISFPELNSQLDFHLYQNYPNPFNPSTKINYKLRTTVYTELKVYDVLGNLVSILVNQKQNAGSYEVEFNGSSLASGIYFYELEVDGSVIDTKRMILLK